MQKAQVQWPPAKKIAKQEKSTFIVTINTLVTDKFVTKEKLQTTINEWYNTSIEQHIKFLIPSDALDKIDAINMEVALEVGEIYQRVHAHAIVTIKHRTRIHLDATKMRSFFKDKLGLKSVHLNIQYAPSTFNLKRYIMKTKQEQ